MTNMKAAVIYNAGGPDVLKVEERSIPDVKPGWVLVRVRAFGLNRSELFTRQGQSPNVQFPRILGIEGVGEIADSSDSTYAKGDTVATAMGGMGRAFDGSYAEYTLVPANQVQKINTSLSWAQFGALPEMIQTAWGSLHTALRIEPGETLLIPGAMVSDSFMDSQIGFGVIQFWHWRAYRCQQLFRFAPITTPASSAGWPNSRDAADRAAGCCRWRRSMTA